MAIYTPPGIYPTEKPTTLPPPASGASESVVAIVGPSVGYRSHTQVVDLSTTPANLAKLGIDTATVTVTAADGTPYVVADDYDLATVAGENSPFDDQITIARDGGGAIGEGESVTVAYRYTDADYFDPLYVTSWSQVTDAFGEPLDTDGSIISPLSLAAKMTLANRSVTKVLLVPTPGTADSVDKDDLADGYIRLLAYSDVDLIAPLPVGITGTDQDTGDLPDVATALKNHLNEAASVGIRRIAVFGTELGSTIDPVTLAGLFAHHRVMLAHPNRMTFFNDILRTTQEIPGYYLAAAAAGRYGGMEPQMPLTRKEISGFSGIASQVLATMSRATMNEWAAGGVAVFERSSRNNSVIICRHGISTDPTSIYTQEISLTRAKDHMLNVILRDLDGAGLIGDPIEEDTAASVNVIVTGSLDGLTQRGTIQGFSGVSVRQALPDKPTTIEVKFAYKPTYPLNFIDVIFYIDTTTGAVTDDTLTT